MSDGSVNVESRTSSQDKRWTIMAALLGTSTAVMLFQGIEQEKNPTFIREVALTLIAATIPFQGIYFLIYTFQLENNGKLSKEMSDRLNLASALCQIVAYGGYNLLRVCCNRNDSCEIHHEAAKRRHHCIAALAKITASSTISPDTPM